MKNNCLFVSFAAIAIAACSQGPAPEADQTETVADSNALLEDWDTPFGVPPLDRIRDEDYLPAFIEGMRRHKAEVEAIASA